MKHLQNLTKAKDGTTFKMYPFPLGQYLTENKVLPDLAQRADRGEFREEKKRKRKLILENFILQGL